MVEEALTKGVKHARTSSCQVLIGYGQDELVLEATDNGAGLPAMAGAGVRAGFGAGLGAGFAGDAVFGAVFGAGLAGGGPALAVSAMPAADGTSVIGGSGHGIIGMRERVSLLGGEFSAGPRPGYGFGVSAHIPLPSGSPRG